MDVCIFPAIPRIIMVVQKIHVVTSFICNKEIILFRPLKMISLSIIVRYNSNVSPFIVIVRNSHFICGNCRTIILLTIIAKTRMNLITRFILRYNIDNTTGRLAAVKNRATASNDFYTINIRNWEIF